MWRLENRSELGHDEFNAINQLLVDTGNHDGFRPLSDQLWLDLIHREGRGFSAVVAVDGTDKICGYAQLAKGTLSTTIELVIPPAERANVSELGRLLLHAALALVATTGGGEVHWWVQRPGDSADVIAADVGLHLGRRLLQLRRALPLTDTTDVETRPFVVGQDEGEWLRVNNAAFHDHPEQGGWTIDTLRQRQSESWFDPVGFRLHERDGSLAAFCWTKVHTDTTPPMGEIYVIAVDPAFQGLGLGRALTIAGLTSLAERGLTVGMLHVDAANGAALSLYEQLGFSIHHADHAYVGDIPSSPP